MSVPLERYGFIGDLHTAALVSDEGSIDWLCVPRFDSDACFAKLLGDETNGCFSIRPKGHFRATQLYEEHTLVLVTRFVTETGTAQVTDFMPVREQHARIVRIVEGIEGTVDFEVDLALRFDYGTAIPWARRVRRGRSFVLGPHAVLLESEAPLEGQDFRTIGRCQVRQGERVTFVLTFYDSVEEPPNRIEPLAALRRTRSYWREWVGHTEKDYGRYDQMVRRSLITLKALTYAPTGGMVAALTTSLPEAIGGSRNWDYRFCWLRDAAFALAGFLEAGHVHAPRAWREWLLRAVAGSAEQLQIMYGVAGERRIPELELDWLAGYEGSRPVRIGNAASGQFQMDVYGEVADVLYRMLLHGIRHDADAWEIQRYLTDHVVKVWEEPDDGIWEIRGERRHFTYSKVMAWVTLDRAIRSMELLGVEGSRNLWRRERDRIRDRVLVEGYNEKVGAFTQYLGGETLDASVLLAPIMGFIDAKDPRMLATIDRIRSNLTTGGLVMRYEPQAGVDGIDEPEGVFLPCSFWMVENLAMAGRIEEAEELLEQLLGAANALGIYSEEYDPSSRRMLGNFAQAFTHVGLIEAVQRVTNERASVR